MVRPSIVETIVMECGLVEVDVRFLGAVGESVGDFQDWIESGPSWLTVVVGSLARSIVAEEGCMHIVVVIITVAAFIQWWDAAVIVVTLEVFCYEDV